MGMNSPQKNISCDGNEAMDMRKMIAVDEKYITRSYFKDDRGTSSPVPPKRNSSKYSKNKHGRKLAEVFRTDFITAMKVPDSQQLPPGEYVTLKDTWRQEWEKGVQVPVNPDKMQNPVSRKLNIDIPGGVPFSLPEKNITFEQDKYRISVDRSRTSCDYDLDDQDVHWLKQLSSLRTLKKATVIDELTMERAITFFERECFEKMAHAVATKEGLSIEYDESTTCNICLSPDAEDGNEIIFCDACMMCAHQHCYGVLEIPEGTWLCNPCSRGILSPPCCLCPNKGGAMKRMKDSYEWIHVICAWWVPEVKIEDVRYIERITKDKIPASRWSLICNVCREKMGACIQCSVKRCVRAYHVTCAVKEGLEMKTVVVPEKNDVQHISYCSKHCTPVPPEYNPNRTKSGEDIENNRMKELRKLECEFYTLVSINKASRELKLNKEACRRLLSYWTMKRRANENVPLIKLTLEQQEKLSGKQGVVFINQQKTLEMERFLHLRQDLERLRNLCYMIVRREKMRKEIQRTSIEVFYKQNDILIDDNEDCSGEYLDFLRHRTTKFSCFSEHYLTEHQYENEYGTRLTIFDSTLEDDDDLLNSSQVEKINSNDLKMIGTAVSPSSGPYLTSINYVRNDYSTDTKTCPNAPDNSSEKSESERNIFEIFDPKTESNIDRCKSSSPVRNSSIGDSVIGVEERNCNEIKNFALEDETNHNADTAIKMNGYKYSEDEESHQTNGDQENDSTKSPLSNDAKTSRLVKKGKKRFRNLHNLSREGCRNSPRLHRPLSSSHSTLVLEDETKQEVIDQEKWTKMISEAKRRRLNSSGDYMIECEEEPPDYVRVTRSRVASCS